MKEVKPSGICITNPRISAVLKKDKLGLLRDMIINKHKSVSRFSKLIGCCRISLSNFLRGHSNPTLRTVMKMCSMLDMEVEEITEKIIAKNKPEGSFIQIDEFPLKSNSIVASLIGHAFGDGHLGECGFQFTNNSQELLDDVISKVKQLPIKNISFTEDFHKAKNINFQSLVKDILASFGAPIGNKVKQTFLVPEWIINGDLEIKQAFLKSLFDDESTVSMGSREIVLNMKKVERLKDNLHNFFEQLNAMLSEFGINGVTITECHPHDGKNGKTIEKRLRICGSFNFIEFRDKINFVNIGKRWKLNKMIENTINLQLRNGEGQRKIIELLSVRNGLNTSEIAEAISLSNWTTWDHLRELEKKNSVRRTRPMDMSKPHSWTLNNNPTK